MKKNPSQSNDPQSVHLAAPQSIHSDILNPVQPNDIPQSIQSDVLQLSQSDDVPQQIQSDIPQPVQSHIAQPVQLNLLQPAQFDIPQPVHSDFVQPVQSEVAQQAQPEIAQPAHYDFPHQAQPDIVQPGQSNIFQPAQQNLYSKIGSLDASDNAQQEDGAQSNEGVQPEPEPQKPQIMKYRMAAEVIEAEYYINKITRQAKNAYREKKQTEKAKQEARRKDQAYQKIIHERDQANNQLQIHLSQSLPEPKMKKLSWASMTRSLIIIFVSVLMATSFIWIYGPSESTIANPRIETFIKNEENGAKGNSEILGERKQERQFEMKINNGQRAYNPNRKEMSPTDQRIYKVFKKCKNGQIVETDIECQESSDLQNHYVVIIPIENVQTPQNQIL